MLGKEASMIWNKLRCYNATVNSADDLESEKKTSFYYQKGQFH